MSESDRQLPWLRDALTQKFGTLGKAASTIKVSTETLRKWWAGSTEPTKANRQAIARLLEKSEAWVLFGDAVPAFEPSPIEKELFNHIHKLWDESEKIRRVEAFRKAEQARELTLFDELVEPLVGNGVGT